MSVDDDEVLTDGAWTLCYLTDDTQVFQDRLSVIVDSGVVPRLVRLLSHNSALVQVPALRVCGNIVTGNARETQAVIDAGAIPALARMLSHPKRNIRKEVSAQANTRSFHHAQSGIWRLLCSAPVAQRLAGAVWPICLCCCRLLGHSRTDTPHSFPVLVAAATQVPLDDSLVSFRFSVCVSVFCVSNITAGGHDQIQSVLDYAEIVPRLVSMMDQDEFVVQKEVTYVLANATEGSEEQIQRLERAGAISALCNVLTGPEARVVLAALTGIDNILRHSTDTVAQQFNDSPHWQTFIDLRHHANGEVVAKCVEMLSAWFPNVDVQDEDELIDQGPVAGLQQGGIAPPGGVGFQFM